MFPFDQLNTMGTEILNINRKIEVKTCFNIREHQKNGNLIFPSISVSKEKLTKDMVF